MKRQQPSIFNDIVGPLMIGPSSSHTCGPSRIGYLSQQLLEGNITKAIIEFAKDGAYTLMYKGQRSDMGFINGILGNLPEDPNLRNSFALAKARGLDFEFQISDFPPIVPNIAKLTLYNEKNEKVIVHSDSTGGGTVKLLKIDDFDVNIVGDCYEVLIKIDTIAENIINEFEQKLKQVFLDNEGIMYSIHNNQTLFNIKLRSYDLVEKGLAQIDKKDFIEQRLIKPVLKVYSNRCAKLPFVSAEELLQLSEKDNKPLWELAIDYEIARSGWSREEVIKYMEFVVETMEQSSLAALKGNINMNGIIEPTAGKIDSYMKNNNNALDMGVLNYAVPWAMATMEYSSAMGKVLCAPTGGSAGVFPGAILGVANYLNLSLKEKVYAMFVTSVVGIVMSKDCNYSAELYGCQVEPGAASAMAAAGLVYLMQGTAKQSLAAASCATQNILGTICDPVAGLVQVPCISRNAMSVANSVVSANMVMGGYDPLIPLDQVAETLFRVGKQLPSELRCTCKGGLCITQKGMQLAREQDERDNQR